MVAVLALGVLLSTLSPARADPGARPLTTPEDVSTWLREERIELDRDPERAPIQNEKVAIAEAEKHIAKAIQYLEEASALEDLAKIGGGPYRGIDTSTSGSREKYRQGVRELARALKRSTRIRELRPWQDGIEPDRGEKIENIALALLGAVDLGGAAGLMLTGDLMDGFYGLPGVMLTTWGVAAASWILPFKRSNGVLNMIRIRLREAQARLGSGTGAKVLGQLRIEAGEKPAKACPRLLEPVLEGA